MELVGKRRRKVLHRLNEILKLRELIYQRSIPEMGKKAKNAQRLLTVLLSTLRISIKVEIELKLPIRDRILIVCGGVKAEPN
jgi:hypothetical protein